MLHRIMAAGFKDVIETDDIAFNVHIWVVDGITNTCLCCQVDHYIKVIFSEQLVDQRLVCD